MSHVICESFLMWLWRYEVCHMWNIYIHINTYIYIWVMAHVSHVESEPEDMSGWLLRYVDESCRSILLCWYYMWILSNETLKIWGMSHAEYMYMYMYIQIRVLSHVRHLTYGCVVSQCIAAITLYHIWVMSHTTLKIWGTSHVAESCHMWVMSHMEESCRSRSELLPSPYTTYESCPLRLWCYEACHTWMSHVPCASCHIWMRHVAVYCCHNFITYESCPICLWWYATSQCHISESLVPCASCHMWISNVTLHCCHHLRDAIIRSRSKRTSQKFQTKKKQKTGWKAAARGMYWCIWRKRRVSHVSDLWRYEFFWLCVATEYVALLYTEFSRIFNVRGGSLLNFQCRPFFLSFGAEPRLNHTGSKVTQYCVI